MNFLLQKKSNGNDINNWTLDELESQVHLFKKEQQNVTNKNVMQQRLEEIELDDGDDYVYYKTIRSDMKVKTMFFEKPHYVIIDHIELIDGGLFTGKYL